MGTRGGNLTDVMQANFSNGTKLPFGPNMDSGVVHWQQVHTRWVTSAIKAGLVKDGHPKTLTVEVMTSLGHMLDIVGLRCNFVVDIKKDLLHTHLTNFAKANPGLFDGSAASPSYPGDVDPFWGLEQINFLPNMFRNMIDEWILRHNGAEVDHKDTRQLNLMGMDQYFKEEAKYYAVLMNGREESKLKHDGVGGPKYIYFDEAKQRWAQRNHNHVSTVKADPADPKSPPFFAGYNPANNIKPNEPLDARVYKPQVEELAHKSIDKDVHKVYDQYYSDLWTVIGIRDLSRQKYQRTNTPLVPAQVAGASAQPPLTKGKPLYRIPGYYLNVEYGGTPGANAIPILTHDPTYVYGGAVVTTIPVLKTIQDIVDILGDQKFTFPMEYVLQSVWHRHMKDAVDILNFVNNPEFEITFTHFNHWIQNFAEVGPFTEVRMENFEVCSRYHDVTRTAWDREFSGKGQHTRPLIDFQWHHNNFTCTFEAGGDPTADDVKGKTIVHKIWPQNLDNIVRQVYILIQSREHFDKLNLTNIAHKYFDVLDAVEWKINGEIFGKKTMDYVDQKVRTNFHYTKKKAHTVTRDQTWVHNMSFDMDMNNSKGGTLNLLPIANNNEWCLYFSIPKLIELYNSQFAEAAYLSLADIEQMRTSIPQAHPLGNGTADVPWTYDVQAGKDNAAYKDLVSHDEVVKGNMFRTSVGSPMGGIKREKVLPFNPASPKYKYTVNFFIALQCLVPNIYMQQEGQANVVRRLPGKA